MATYKDIQLYVNEKFNITVKTCWIADVKEKHGIKMKIAPNRKPDGKRVYPCPEKYVYMIVDSLIHFEVINS